MANMLASIKILPKDITVDLTQLKDQIEKALPTNVKIEKFQEEPIAFGLKALIAHVTMPEKEEGIMSKLENAINSMSAVGEIQVIGMTRL